MSIFIIIVGVIISAIVCCFLGIGYVIEQYTQGRK